MSNYANIGASAAESCEQVSVLGVDVQSCEYVGLVARVLEGLQQSTAALQSSGIPAAGQIAASTEASSAGLTEQISVSGIQFDGIASSFESASGVIELFGAARDAVSALRK